MDNSNGCNKNSDDKVLDPECWRLNFPIYPPPYYPWPPRTPYNTSLYPAIGHWTYFWTENRPSGYWMHVREIVPGTMSNTYAAFGCVRRDDGTTSYVGESFSNINNFIIAYFS